ncbi:MAG: DUF166 domain-containing protein [Candidatus Bathyarchaeia archaeon]
MRLYILYGDEYGERVVGNLVNLSTFCEACGLACNHCRSEYDSFSSDIHQVDKVLENSPMFIDSPETHLPDDLPKCDVVIAAGIHPDLLTAIPTIANRTGARGVIVPIEDGVWCPRGLQKQLEASLDDMGVEHAFPKPFCTLEECGKPAIDAFVRRYRVGRPMVEVEVSGGRVSDAWVVRSAPCGSTWYVAQQIRWRRLSEIEDAVARAHHSYPCTASMATDRELGEPILHTAGYAVREAVKGAIAEASV